jgi:hypothetical protein
MDDNLTKAQHYRDQAAKFRTLSSQEDNLEARKALLITAETYDRLHRKFLGLARHSAQGHQ